MRRLRAWSPPNSRGRQLHPVPTARRATTPDCSVRRRAKIAVRHTGSAPKRVGSKMSTSGIDGGRSGVGHRCSSLGQVGACLVT